MRECCHCTRCVLCTQMCVTLLQLCYLCWRIIQDAFLGVQTSSTARPLLSEDDRNASPINPGLNATEGGLSKVCAWFAGL